MNESRIPELTTTPAGVRAWFEQMVWRDLLFHPDDAPGAIVTITNGERVFSDAECRDLGVKLDAMFEALGDGVYEAAWPVFRNALGRIISDTTRAGSPGPDHQV